jgi:hypothetical protein
MKAIYIHGRGGPDHLVYLVVYEDEQGSTFLACYSFVSLLAQYQREEITQVTRLVEHKLEALVAEVTAAGRV